MFSRLPFPNSKMGKLPLIKSHCLRSSHLSAAAALLIAWKKIVVTSPTQRRTGQKGRVLPAALSSWPLLTPSSSWRRNSSATCF